MSVQEPNTFEIHRGAILASAGYMYRAERAGLPVDPEISAITILPRNLGDLTPRELGLAEIAQARVNCAARAIARVAILRDEIDAGGPRGLLARLEHRLTTVAERGYLHGATEPGEIIDQIRARDTDVITKS